MDPQAFARAGRRGAEPPPRPSSSPRTPATCQCAPGSDSLRQRLGAGARGTRHLYPPTQAPAGRAATSHPPSPPAGRARRGRALEPGAAHRPPGAPVSPVGHSPPQLSVLCSTAGNDLRKRFGEGLRQAARAQRGDVLRSHLPIYYGWKQIRKSQFCTEPLLRRREASCSREGAAARIGRRWQGDGEEEGRETFISRLDSDDVCSWSAETDRAAALGNLGRLKASSVVFKSWIEIKGHKRLGMDKNWVLKISAKSTLGTTAV